MLLLPGSLLAAAAVVLTVALLVVHTEQKIVLAATAWLVGSAL